MEGLHKMITRLGKQESVRGLDLMARATTVTVGENRDDEEESDTTEGQEEQDPQKRRSEDREKDMEMSCKPRPLGASMSHQGRDWYKRVVLKPAPKRRIVLRNGPATSGQQCKVHRDKGYCRWGDKCEHLHGSRDQRA